MSENLCVVGFYTEMLKMCYALDRESPRAYDVRQEGWASRALSGALLFLPPGLVSVWM